MPMFRAPAPALMISLLALAACSMPTEPEGVHQEGFTRIGEKLQAKGDDNGAADFYLQALQQKPGDVETLQHLSALFEAHGQVEAAENYNKRALAGDPKNADLLLAEGRLLIRLGRPGEALQAYNDVLENDRHNIKAMNGYGVALDYLGRHDEAQKIYEDALVHAPDDLPTLNNLGHSYVLTGHYAEAINLLEPHARAKEATPALRQNLAEAYGLSGMYLDAERMAKIDLTPEQVKRNMAGYRARHAKVEPQPRFRAELGSYPTQDMADAAAAKVNDAAKTHGVTVSAEPVVDAAGGTPRFAVVTSGFKTEAAFKEFCRSIAAGDVACANMKR